MLCDTWNRIDNNDTVWGIAILDTTAIPEMRPQFQCFFFRNRQSHTLVITEMCVSSSVSTLNCLYSDKAMACCVYCMKCTPASVNITRSQAVAKIADRTSSQHFWRSRDVIGHVTIWHPYAISFGLTKPLSPTVSEIFNVECKAMVDRTLIRPLNKGQGHSFWYRSISHIRFHIGCQ